MARISISFKLHPRLVKQLKKQAHGLGVTEGTMMEMIMAATWKNEMPDFKPGLRMPDEKKDSAGMRMPNSADGV